MSQKMPVVENIQTTHTAVLLLPAIRKMKKRKIEN